MKLPALGYVRRAATGSIAGTAVGVAVIMTINTAYAPFRSESPTALWDEQTPFQILLVSMPFLGLALLGVAARGA